MTALLEIPVLARLRAATAAAHERLEAALGLLDPGLDLARYAAILGRVHGFWRGWQPAVAARLAEPELTGPRQRLHLLASDLAGIGLAPAQIAALPACPPPRLPNLAAALGSLYVLEGSTLGGRVILKTLAPRLGLTESAGCSYFAGYGAATGAMWQNFLARLAQTPDQSDTVTGAVDTFTTLTDWLRV